MFEWAFERCCSAFKPLNSSGVSNLASVLKLWPGLTESPSWWEVWANKSASDHTEKSIWGASCSCSTGVGTCWNLVWKARWASRRSCALTNYRWNSLRALHLQAPKSFGWVALGPEDLTAHCLADSVATGLVSHQVHLWDVWLQSKRFQSIVAVLGRSFYRWTTSSARCIHFRLSDCLGVQDTALAISCPPKRSFWG